MLRKGITGFRHIKDAPLPEVPLATFKSACYHIASLVDAQVARIEEASVGNNYHSATLLIAGEPILIVCNCVFPILAFATPNGFEFIDFVLLTDAFVQIGGFTVATRDSLSKEVSVEAVANLSFVELEQIRKWKPETLGDVVFNFWD